MDKELIEVRARMEDLALQVQQNTKTHWVYEWPMRRKVKWPVKELMIRRQQRLLKMWLRYAESLKDEEEVVHVCEPKAGRNLSEDEEKMRSVNLIDYQVSIEEESSYFHVGDDMRSKNLIRC
jgi:hypothetical protein